MMNSTNQQRNNSLTANNLLSILLKTGPSSTPAGSYLSSVQLKQTGVPSSLLSFYNQQHEAIRHIYKQIRDLSVDMKIHGKTVPNMQRKLELTIAVMTLIEIFSGSLKLNRVSNLLYASSGGALQKVANIDADTTLFPKINKRAKHFHIIESKLYKSIPNLLLSRQRNLRTNLSYAYIVDTLLPKKYSEMDQIKQSLKEDDQQIFKHNELMFLLEILYVKYLDTTDAFAYKDTKRVFHKLKRMRGEEVIFGKRLSKWVDLFLKRRIRFIEINSFDKQLNYLFELHRLKIVHHDFLNNHMDQSEMHDQIWLSMDYICKSFANDKELLEKHLQFICANKPSIRKLNIPSVTSSNMSQEDQNMRLLFNQFSETIVEMYHYLVFERNVLDDKSLTDCVLYCQRILSVLLDIWIRLIESERTVKRRADLSLNFVHWIEQLFQTSKRVLYKYGSQFMFTAKSLKMLGKLYSISVQKHLNSNLDQHYSHLCQQIESEVLDIFQNYLTNQLPKILLFYATKNSFPHKQYFEVLKGLISVCVSTDGVNKEQPYLPIDKFETLLSSAFTTPTWMDFWHSKMRSRLPQTNTLSPNKLPVLPQVSQISIDWKLQHARAVYLFSLRMNKYNNSYRLPAIIHVLCKEGKNMLDHPAHLYPIVSVITNLISDGMVKRENQKIKQEECLFQLLSTVANDQIYNTPEILTLLVQISTQLADPEKPILRDNSQFVKNVWQTCLIPMFTKPEMRNSEFFTMRFLFINGIGRMARRDGPLTSTVLKGVERFVKDITKQSSRTTVKQEPTGDAAAKDGDKELNGFMGDVSASIVVLLWRLLESSEESKVTTEHVAHCMKIMSFLEMFKYDNLAYRETIKCAIERSNGNILPSQKQLSKLMTVNGDFLLKSYRVLFYLRLATAIITDSKRVSKKVVTNRIIPFMFSCMESNPSFSSSHEQSLSVWLLIIHQTFQLVLQFFSQTEGTALSSSSVQSALIPHYLNVLEGKYLQKASKQKQQLVRRKFCETGFSIIPKLISQLNSSVIRHIVEKLEHLLIQKMDDSISSGADGFQKSKEDLTMLFWVFVQSAMTVSSLTDLEAIILPSIRRILEHIKIHSASKSATTASLKQLFLTMFYQVTSKCMDYTRKQTCVNFYLALVKDMV